MNNENIIGKRIENLQAAIEKGTDYLFEHQYPNGEFCAYSAPDEKMQEWCYPEANVFCTSVIASCLLKLKEDDKISKVLIEAGTFLRFQMMRGGLWNFFTKFHVTFKFTPADVDTTVYTSALLKALGIDFPDNKYLLHNNMNKHGLFYTWIVWRLGTANSVSRLKILGREFKRPIKSLLFWLQFEAKRDDIDAVVNANALFYLGLTKKTESIITYLVDILKNANEEASDKWYKNPIVFYYAVSRNYPSIKELKPIKPIIIKRLMKKLNEDGSFGKSHLDNALVLVTLLNLGYSGSNLEMGIETLIRTQSKSGHWDRALLFYSGPKKVVGWGSEEITTAFCLEALAMYRDLQR